MTTVKDLMKLAYEYAKFAARENHALDFGSSKELEAESKAKNIARDVLQSALEAQAAEIERLKSDNEDLRRDEALNDAEAKIAELQSKLDAMQSVEPDCWAILTPNGSRLVAPAETNGYKNSYPLYTHPKVAEPAAIPKEYQRGTRLVSLQTEEHAVVKIVGRTTCVIEWFDGSFGEYTSQQLDENFGFADHGIDAECIRHSFDGYGWKYVDSGFGSDWYARGMEFEDAQPLYADRLFPSSKVAEPLTDCRIELVTVIHTLARHFENRLYRLDVDDRKLAKGDISHAMQVAAKWNWNGITKGQQ